VSTSSTDRRPGQDQRPIYHLGPSSWPGCRTGDEDALALERHTFKNRIHRFLEQLSERVPREQIEGSGEEALAAQEVVEAAIRSHETGQVVDVPLALAR
jgi:predicted dehydrogenase